MGFLAHHLARNMKSRRGAGTVFCVADLKALAFVFPRVESYRLITASYKVFITFSPLRIPLHPYCRTLRPHRYRAPAKRTLNTTLPEPRLSTSHRAGISQVSGCGASAGRELKLVSNCALGFRPTAILSLDEICLTAYLQSMRCPNITL
jgi:hypothetical protein